jgi:hypothetical protein
VAPDALEGFAFPELFGQERAVIRRVLLGTEQADGAVAINLADAVDRRISGHPAADDQVPIIQHGSLLLLNASLLDALDSSK